MNGKADKIEALARCELFRELSEPSLDSLAGCFAFRHWSKGRVFSPEWSHEGFHVVVDGRLELMRCNLRSGRGFTVSLLFPGDAFDLLRLAGDHEHHVTPAAVDSLVLLSAPLERIRQWREAQKGFSGVLLRALAKQLIALEQTATDLAVYDTSTRLARLLLRHLENQREQSSPGTVIDLPNEVLARSIGTVRVVLNRHIQELKRSGAVETRRGALEILNLEELLARSQELESD
ncbi:MAG: Crp/Fnr family transcriptional regulator [Myxococcota bacterium]